MTREKRRLTLEELKSLPVMLWMLEVAQIWTDATTAGLIEIAEEADLLPSDPNLTPEMIVALGEKLQRATGSTYQYEDQLPATMTDAEYDAWYAKSWIQDGVRVGPRVTAAAQSDAA